MSTPSCFACNEPCADMARRFDPDLRFVCPECHSFMLHASKALRKAGVEGVDHEPVRYSPTPETEKP